MPQATGLVDDAGTIGRFLEHLRWSVIDTAGRDLAAGDARHEEHDRTRLHVVLSGTIWLSHGDEVVELDRGDVALLPQGGPTRLSASDDARLLSATVALVDPTRP
ncbi:cupin domain-containing protein [Agromyces sp. Marseille-Q5079]|uniref:cupin domain-containing protein n=1 Tax=Agromyces sp. Marseille-Q5079 TaxID=3439059 RepID=UPI003D9C81B5